ncbi:MAG: spore maturation protein [bacterium]|nr:spore maturation protein [bacterium]
MTSFTNGIQLLSDSLLPLLLFAIIGFGIRSKRPVFDDFTDGAREGMKTVVGIFPTLLGLMSAIGVLRASGFLDFLGQCLQIPAAFLHLPEPLIPLVLVRLISNSAALGLLFDLFKTYGPDSPIGLAASILMSCTETVFYTMSVYFLSVKVSKTRWTLAGALFSTAAGLAASLLLVF